MFGLTGENHHLFGLSYSIAFRAKISETKGTIIFVYDTQSSLVNTFNSTNKAAEFFNCSYTTIFKNANNNKLFKNKWYLFLNKNFLVNTGKGFSDSDK